MFSGQAMLDSQHLLPFFPNRKACYQHILGKYKKRCLTGSDHLDKDKLPDATVEELCNMLAPGVAAMCLDGGAPAKSSKKRKKQG